MTDKDANYMKDQWGTQYLSTEYGWERQILLREITHEKYNKRRHNFEIQNELHSQIRNDEDYDDWEYGTEPLYESSK